MSLRALSTSVACSRTEHCGCHHAAIVQSLPRITIKVGVHITDSTLCRGAHTTYNCIEPTIQRMLCAWT